MRDEFESRLARFETLEKDLQDPAVQADSQRLSSVAREHGTLAKVALKYRSFLEMGRRIVDSTAMLEGDDPGLRELAANRYRQPANGSGEAVGGVG